MSASELAESRDRYNRMYAQRQATMPETMNLAYWQDHFVTRFLLDNLPRRARILDVGCGTGEIAILLARALPEVTIAGVDPSDYAIGVAAGHLVKESEDVRARVGFLSADVASLAHGERFDCVVMSHIVEHVLNLETFFQAVASRLCEFGSGYVVVPLGHHYDDPTHVWHFSPDTLRAELAKHWRHVFVDIAPGADQIAAIVRRPIVSAAAMTQRPSRVPNSEQPYGDFVAMLRVKDEAEWIEATLDRVSELVDAIVILDDGSSDGTADLCEAYPKVRHVHRQRDLPTDEVRDKNVLLKLALALQPKWILAMDGDEVLEDAALQVIPRAMREASPEIGGFAFEWLYFWDRPDQYRIDGRYANLWFTRLFRVPAQGADQLVFSATEHGGNFHCGSVPTNLPGLRAKLEVRVKHYGYYFRDQRLRKHRFYLGKDPVAAGNGYYDHLVDETGMVLLQWRERQLGVGAGGMTGVPAPTRVWEMLSAESSFEYPDSPRLELVNLVLGKPQRALEIGCYKGATGMVLKERHPGLRYIGVEPSERAAEVARRRLDQVVVKSFEAVDFGDAAIFGEPFDAIVLADVLEHLYDPWRALVTLRRLLAPAGLVYVSLPNVRNFLLINDLVNGRWRYERAGLLDVSHIRFFTLAESLRMFAETGFAVEKTVSVKDPRINFRSDFSSPTTLVGENFTLQNVGQQTAMELATVQFLFVLRAA